MLRYQLLGVLRRTDGHGYALAKEYLRLSGRRISPGNVYRELQRLVGEGLVRQLPRPPDGDQRRAPYEITESGLAAFDEWFVGIPRASAPGDSELAARALFFADVDTPLARQVLAHWRSDLWNLIKELERELLRPTGERGTLDALRSLVRCRMRQLAAELELLDDLERVFSLKTVDAPPLVSGLELEIPKRTPRRAAADGTTT